MASKIFGALGSKLAAFALFAGATGTALQSALFNVEPGYRAIIFDRYAGVRSTIYKPGTHFLIPGLQYAIPMDVRVRPRVLSTATGTKDLQQVNLSLRLLSHPDDLSVKEIYRELGLDFDERVIPSIGNEVLKAIVAQYNAEELLTLRDKVSAEIRASLTERARDFHIVLDDVSITHLAFSEDFARAIENKQIAQQQAERAKFVVQKAEQEKRALIIKSEGDAEAARMVSDAISKFGRGLIEIRKIETAQAVAATLARARNITYLPSSGNMLFNLSTQPLDAREQQQQQQH